MKKHKGHSDDKAFKKRGKGAAESGESNKRKDPNDMGDPRRGSRAPQGDHPTEMHEKGDKNRPFKR